MAMVLVWDSFGGTVAGAQATTLNGALLADTAGTGGLGTSITLTSATDFTTWRNRRNDRCGR